ncbi:MAG: mechanosensitive ion channel protein MscS, partial [Puniceicoccaceae bacterium]|nr:mechanosensitive ion channel protein MscS [Puniceicoccaceae bacterium]
LIEQLKKIPLIKEYLEEKLEEIDSYNNQTSNKNKIPRHLTNIGVFRKYCLEYLKHHPQINSEMTLIVRQLAPTGQGIPLEIWTYSDTTNWVIYESIQSDLFDHLFTAMNSFELRAYQRPNGKDLYLNKDDSIKIDL